MNLIWSDFNIESENSQKMIQAKNVNGPDYWPTMREVFKYDCAHLPLNRFRLWASVHNVPLVTQYKTSRFLGETFYAIARDKRLANALQENWIGIPQQYQNVLRVSSDFDTSMQRVQNMAHLLICNFKPEDLSSYNSIVEIGAGYGDMCSLVHSLGFKGKYTIVDIPEVWPIQQFYLNKQGIEPHFSFEDDNVSHADLVIATWSLSETPIEYRDLLVPKIYNSKNWLILSLFNIFGNSFNEDYFNNMFSDKNVEKIPLISDGLSVWDGGNMYYVVK
jgi:hypothetical protein